MFMSECLTLISDSLVLFDLYLEVFNILFDFNISIIKFFALDNNTYIKR